MTVNCLDCLIDCLDFLIESDLDCLICAIFAIDLELQRDEVKYLNFGQETPS